MKDSPLAADSSDRFAFGENWRRFLSLLTDDRIAGAEASLRELLGQERLDGRRFLDLGSGSGLFSLAARRLGATVHSFDFDAESVACTEELHRRYFPGDASWTIEKGSVLDPDFIAKLGSFDVVYSWGVLHHTGQLWTALDQAARPLRLGGLLAIALYNDQGPISRYWATVKHAYHRGPLLRAIVVGLHAPYLIGLRGIVRRLRGRARLERGMSLRYDMHDWLGGMPFEVAAPDRVIDFVEARHFKLIRMKTVGHRHGCNEFVFERVSP